MRGQQVDVMSPWNGGGPSCSICTRTWSDIHHLAASEAPNVLEVKLRNCKEWDVRASHPLGAGATPLLLACAFGRADTVAFLLKKGCDPLLKGAVFEPNETIDSFECAVARCDPFRQFSSDNDAGVQVLATLFKAREDASASLADCFLVKSGTCPPRPTSFAIHPEFRVRSVFLSSQAAALLTDNGCVFTWGNVVSYGRLGHAMKRSSPGPRRVQGHLSVRSIVAMACGQHHMAAVDDAGRVFTWGKRQYAGLSAGKGDYLYYAEQPELVEGLRNVKVTHVSCGDLHTLFRTHDGNVYACGAVAQGRLGCVEESKSTAMVTLTEPKQVAMKEGVYVVQIAAGKSHSVALDRDGRVWCWGLNTDGRCGGENTKKVIPTFRDGRQTGERFNVQCFFTPTELKGVVSHCIGAGDDFTAFCEANGTWGYVGRGSFQPKQGPRVAEGVRSLSAGGSRVSLLTTLGEIRLAWPETKQDLFKVDLQERISFVSEGPGGTVGVVGRDRSDLGEALRRYLLDDNAPFVDFHLVSPQGVRVACHRCILWEACGEESDLKKALANNEKELACPFTEEEIRGVIEFVYSDRCTRLDARKMLPMGQWMKSSCVIGSAKGEQEVEDLTCRMRRLLKSAAFSDVHLEALTEDDPSLGDEVLRGDVGGWWHDPGDNAQDKMWKGLSCSSFRCNKCVLFARCPYFRAMLGEFKERDNNVLSLDACPTSLAIVLRHLYCGPIQMYPNQAATTLPIADAFQLRMLQSFCEAELERCVDDDSCCYCFALASQTNANALAVAAVTVAAKEWDKVSVSKYYQSEMPQDEKKAFLALVSEERRKNPPPPK